MSWFATTVHAEFLFETAFPFFWGELSLSEQGSVATSLKLTTTASCIDFCCGTFFSCEFLNLRGKTTSFISSIRGIRSQCKHAEGTIQILSFIDKVWECG